MSEMLPLVKSVFADILLSTPTLDWNVSTPLLGAVAEFDSMAIVAVITQLEQQLGILVEDDELTAEVFTTVGTLCDYLDEKQGR